MHLRNQFKIQIKLSAKRLFLVFNCLIAFCMNLSQVNGQGNRGIIINNQKIETLSSNEYPQLSTIVSETAATSTSTVKPQVMIRLKKTINKIYNFCLSKDTYWRIIERFDKNIVFWHGFDAIK